MNDDREDLAAVAAGTAALIRRYRWDLFVTLTTKRPAGVEILSKRYREFVRLIEEAEAGLSLGRRPLWRPEERLRHVLAWELQRRDAWHLHALWAAPGAKGIRREWARKQWNRLCRPKTTFVEEEAYGVHWLVTPSKPARGRRGYQLEGIADLSPVRSDRAVASYCAKYVAKAGAVELFGLSHQD